MPGISASEGWVVVAEDDSEECEPDTEDLTFPLGSKMQAAPVHGPAQTLQTCATADVPAALVDGSDAAYLSCNLDSVIVRDLHRPGVPATSIALAPPLAPAGATPRPSYRVAALAGDYLLVTESSAPNALPLDGTATVYDWRTGRAVVTLAGPMALNGTSLDRQGTLVVIQQPPNAPRTSACALTGDETLAWFSPSAPFEHLIDATPCGFAADVSGDMVIFPRLLASHPGANRDVTDEALTALSGTGTRQLVSPEQAGTAQPDGVATFAADGELEVYRSGCGDATQIEFYTLAQVLRGIPATSRCPLVIEPSATRVRDGSIAITLRCPRGCSGHVTLRTSTGTPIPLTPATGYPFELDPGRTTITATPQARASRLLGGINKLIVSIVVQTPGSFPASRLHSGHRVTRRVTLHTKE